jgi:glutathione S-transferase
MNESLYQLLADAVLVLHVAIVIFVVMGLLLIVIGNLLARQWVNASWFRLAHLVTIAVVVAEAWAGIVCPLTTLEMWLRSNARAITYSGSFIQHWLQPLLFWQAPAWVFTVAYSLFGLVVVAVWWYFPPRFVAFTSTQSRTTVTTGREREMAKMVLTTYDWVPEFPRGHVRDIRARWALEEAGLPYSIQSVPFRERGAEHFAHQPFGQVPWLTDGDLSIFESGAMLLYIGERSEALLPVDPPARAHVQEWLFAALNSVEMASLPWFILTMSGDTTESPGRQKLDAFLNSRLTHMETILAGREWLSGAFSIADIAMADVLRLVERLGGLVEYPACSAYVARATARPAFVKAHADQMAHFAD